MEYTLIMAAKDGATLIAETLESVKAQTFKPAQIALVIDHAVDNTVEVALSVIPDIEVYFSEGYGMVPALNLGIEKARYGYLSFLDHDDLWQPDKQERQISFLNAHQEFDAVCSATRNFSKKTIDGQEISTSRDFNSARLFSATTFRRECFEKYGKIDESQGHFQWLYEWWSKASSEGISCAHLEEVHLLRRVHETNSWVTHQEEAHRQVLEMVRRHKNRST